MLPPADLPLYSPRDEAWLVQTLDENPSREELGDCLAELVALRTDRLWMHFRGHRLNPAAGGEARVVLEPKRMLVVKGPLDRPSRPLQAHSLEHDEIINWHKPAFEFFNHSTCENILGSMRNASLFRETMLRRFPGCEGVSTIYPKAWWRVRLGQGPDKLLAKFMDEGHRARRMAAELSMCTTAAPATARRKRL